MTQNAHNKTLNKKRRLLLNSFVVHFNCFGVQAMSAYLCALYWISDVFEWYFMCRLFLLLLLLFALVHYDPRPNIRTAKTKQKANIFFFVSSLSFSIAACSAVVFFFHSLYEFNAFLPVLFSYDSDRISRSLDALYSIQCENVFLFFSVYKQRHTLPASIFASLSSSSEYSQSADEFNIIYIFWLYFFFCSLFIVFYVT